MRAVDGAHYDDLLADAGADSIRVDVRRHDPCRSRIEGDDVALAGSDHDHAEAAAGPADSGSFISSPRSACRCPRPRKHFPLVGRGEDGPLSSAAQASRS